MTSAAGAPGSPRQNNMASPNMTADFTDNRKDIPVFRVSRGWTFSVACFTWSLLFRGRSRRTALFSEIELHLGRRFGARCRCKVRLFVEPEKAGVQHGGE